MIQIKRKGQDIVFNTENTVILKEPLHDNRQAPLVPAKPNNNTSDIPFSRWREERCPVVEEIKAHFTRVLAQLPTDYVYHVNSKNLEQDIEHLIYRTSSNRSRYFPRPSDLVS